MLGEKNKHKIMGFLFFALFLHKKQIMRIILDSPKLNGTLQPLSAVLNM